MEHRSIFRKKSMDALSSPEQLNEYIRVANPGIWIVLAAVLALLVGICVWGVMGRLDTTIRVAAVSDGKHLTCYVKEQDIESLKTGMELKIKGTETVECRITDVSTQPITVDDTFDEYTIHVGGLQQGAWVYVVETDGTIPDGIYAADIVIDSVAPRVFVLN